MDAWLGLTPKFWFLLGSSRPRFCAPKCTKLGLILLLPKLNKHIHKLMKILTKTWINHELGFVDFLYLINPWVARLEEHWNLVISWLLNPTVFVHQFAQNFAWFLLSLCSAKCMIFAPKIRCLLPLKTETSPMGFGWKFLRLAPEIEPEVVPRGFPQNLEFFHGFPCLLALGNSRKKAGKFRPNTLVLA